MAGSITWRVATQDELERCDVADQASLIDGAGAVLRDGGLIGLTNEYGTCVWVSPDVKPSEDRVLDAKALIEHFAELAGELAGQC